MGWLLGVMGVVLLGVLADVLLPKGQMSKYVKGIFAVLTMFVFISPVVRFFRQDMGIVDLINFDAGSYESDEAYIDFIEIERTQAALDAIRARYAAVYDLQIINGEDKVVQVYVQGSAPAGLGEYVCIVLSVEPSEVVIYESG
jgi:stage III sporulation protein AF